MIVAGPASDHLLRQAGHGVHDRGPDKRQPTAARANLGRRLLRLLLLLLRQLKTLPVLRALTYADRVGSSQGHCEIQLRTPGLNTDSTNKIEGRQVSALPLMRLHLERKLNLHHGAVVVSHIDSQHVASMHLGTSHGIPRHVPQTDAIVDGVEVVDLAVALEDFYSVEQKGDPERLYSWGFYTERRNTKRTAVGATHGYHHSSRYRASLYSAGRWLVWPWPLVRQALKPS